MSESADDHVTFSFRSGHGTELVFDTPILHVRLDVDPDDPETHDDRFRLYSSDGTYDRTLTVADDKVAGDGFLDLVFDNLKEGLTYSLEVDEGSGGDKYLVFEEVAYQDLIDYYSELEDDDELEEAEDEDDDTEEEEEEQDFDWADEGEGSQQQPAEEDVQVVDSSRFDGAQD